MKVTKEKQEKARAFVYEHARPLERALFAYYFEGGTAGGVLAKLATYQNKDGGFGRALEPDLRLADSSTYATTVGLQLLRELKVSADHALAQGAMRYLLDTYDREQERWPMIPETANQAPHAPWWHYDDELPEHFGQFLANPRAEIVGYLYDYAGLVPADLRRDLTRAVVAHLDALPGTMEMHDLLCYVRLAETKTLPEETRARILAKLQPAVDQAVARDPATWAAYGLQPLTVVNSPDSPFAAMLAGAIEANLDYQIEQQQADGSWGPNWSWADSFPAAWAQAEQEWRGLFTVKTLKTVQNFGRLE